MFHRLTFLLLWLLPTSALAAPTFQSTQIKLIEAGIICAHDPVAARDAPNTLAGETFVLETSPEFIAQGQIVPAALGVGFGVRSLARTEDGLDDITFIITHPPMGNQATVEQSFQSRISGISPSITFYQFDYDYELVTGTWTMTAMRNDKPLYEVAFEVVPPEELPALANACGYIDLLS
ncbi:DUF3859 domain-containing protein [Loktanella sp. S4079]|uniref:DUF3859 domain-containing protein n=1 Tax=Loktanella sp. S4079 TaxID=579483 RepID=UPI000697F46E|nr:DUF3859 domain-containing protein [Loktanella sp. S4079]